MKIVLLIGAWKGNLKREGLKGLKGRGLRREGLEKGCGLVKGGPSGSI